MKLLIAKILEEGTFTFKIKDSNIRVSEFQPEMSLKGKLKTTIPKYDGNKSAEWECSICLKNLAEVLKSFLIHSKYIILI